MYNEKKKRSKFFLFTTFILFFSSPKMSYTANFEGSSEIGAYAKLTNTYILIGKSVNRHFYSTFQENMDIPICETLINTIPTVGSLCTANKNGLLLPYTTTDSEMQHIRNSLPENVKIRRVEERLNALGNVILANDRMALLHPEINKETEDIIADVLKVEVIRMSLGEESLVGTFGCLNNIGLLVHPGVKHEEIEELSNILEVQVVAGTINKGQPSVGGGIIVNDWIGYVGYRSTVHERTVLDNVFGLSVGDEEQKKKAFIDELVK